MSGGSKISDPINQTTRLKEQNFDTEKNFKSSKDSTNHNNNNYSNRSWNWFGNSLKTLMNGFYNGFQTTKNSLSTTLNNAYSNTLSTLSYTLEILKNPIILINTICGLSLISTLLIGYIKYEKRFLMGKPNSFIWTCLFGSTALLSVNCYLLNEYFIKKI